MIIWLVSKCRDDFAVWRRRVYNVNVQHQDDYWYKVWKSITNLRRDAFVLGLYASGACLCSNYYVCLSVQKLKNYIEQAEVMVDPGSDRVFS